MNNPGSSDSTLTHQERMFLEIEQTIQRFHHSAPNPQTEGPEKRKDYVNDGLGILGSVLGRYMCHVAYEQGVLNSNSDEKITESMLQGIGDHILGSFRRKRSEIGM